MPTIQEIKLALGKMDESSENPSREVLSLNENIQPNPFSEKLFANKICRHNPLDSLFCVLSTILKDPLQ